MKTFILAAIAALTLATTAEAYTVTRCTNHGTSTRCVTLGDGAGTFTRCTKHGTSTRCVTF